MAFLLSLTEIASVSCGFTAKHAFRSCSSSESKGRNTIRKPRVCVLGKVKDHESKVIRVSDPVREGSVSPLFSGPVLRVSSSSSPPSPSLRQQQQQQQRDGVDDEQNYHLNMGYAIRTLREELLDIFDKEPSFDIYRDDIVFKDPLNTFVGMDNYKMIFWVLRFTGRLFFESLWVDIVSIWQPVKNTIMIRWIVHGIPRVPWECHGRFDGTSEYKLDKNGKIYEHRVDNVALNSPPKFRILAVEELIQSLGCPSTPKPTYFEMSVSSVVVPCMPFLLRFTVVRYHLAFCLALTWQCTPKG